MPWLKLPLTLWSPEAKWNAPGITSGVELCSLNYSAQSCQFFLYKICARPDEHSKLKEEKTKLQTEVDEMKGEMTAMESIQSESEGQLEADKKTLQERVQQLEKDLKQAKDKQVGKNSP